MTLSIQRARAVLKIGAIYTFALMTAVACGKAESTAKIKGTANGTAAVTADGAVSNSIAIEKVTTVFTGQSPDGMPTWNITVNLAHGQRKLAFTTKPMVEPYYQDSAYKTIAPYDYTVEGVCGNPECSSFGVMATIRDTSNGTVLNVFEYWDLYINTLSPKMRVQQTQYTNVEEAYTAVTGIKLNTND